MKSIKAAGGGVYRQEFYKCNKERCKKCRDGPGHGPYWSRYWWEDGRTRKEYIGKNLPLTKDDEVGAISDSALTKDETLPKTLTKDKPSPKSLPKTPQTLTKAGLTKDKSLPKTRKKALPKTEEGVIERAIEAIRDFHRRGIEPSVSEVAEVVGAESKPLGRHLKAMGLEAQNVRRDGVRARRYTIDLKPKIEGMLEASELEK
jgi:hypothetical protein